MTNTNRLIHEDSPYLKQHAHNPVDWHPWSSETLKLAQETGKPLLISIGYAACHWCHVMEHESFEDEATAEEMNKYFINIKVDREEHPDVDRIYMNAMRLLNGNGGWPLNIFATPTGTPFFGATYVPQKNWIKRVKEIAEIYYTQGNLVDSFSIKMKNALKLYDLAEKIEHNTLEIRLLHAVQKEHLKEWDLENGGNLGAPKFMMPIELNYILDYAILEKNSESKAHVLNTLKKIGYGGIFDVVDGGFSRYSVDEKWHIPHFEKMLYDNALLLSVYSKAYRHYKEPFFKEIISKTIDFLLRDFKNEQDLFFASYDADSINPNDFPEEGAYYTWKKESLETLLGNNFTLFKTVYNINSTGYWEDDKYVLYRTKSLQELANELEIDEQSLTKTLQSCLDILRKERLQRSKPSLDHKTITSWNGYMICALIDTYLVLKDKSYLEQAIKSGKAILQLLTNNDNKLYHTLNPSKKIAGYLEDYSAVITAFIKIFEATGNQEWLNEAKFLTNICYDDFYEEKNGLFYFTAKDQEVLISRSLERIDDVTPSSNSQMAHNLYTLSNYISSEKMKKDAITMTSNLFPDARTFPKQYSNWLDLALKIENDSYEIIIVGKNAEEIYLQFMEQYQPNHFFAFSTQPSDLLIFKNRYQENKTLIYVCKNNICHLPHDNIDDAMKELSN